MMKRALLITLLCVTAMSQLASARNGYRIQLKFSDIKDSLVYLAYYYGKPLPNAIYKVDSATVDKKGIVTFQSKDTATGGIYLILLSDHKTYFEFLLNNGDDMEIDATIKNLPTGNGLAFKNSAENEHFMEYVKFLKDYGTKHQQLIAAYTGAHTTADSNAAREKIKEHSEELINYRHAYAKKEPKTLLAAIFRALEIPQVPEGVHYLEDGKTVDSEFSYHYTKAHFWDGFDFQDDRLIHTPIFDAKLNQYFNNLVLPTPDSIEVEADRVLAKARGTKEIFKYSLWWLEHNAQDSKIMGMDAVVVYLVENYYMKGDATWLSNEDLQKYIDYASKIAPNVIGNLAPEIKMPDASGKDQSLLGLKSKYTLLVFWAPDCGHCQVEIPKLDSLYKASLKAKGVKVYTVKGGGTEQQWKDFIKKYDLGDWINVYDPDGTHQDFRSKYDVYSTPILYLLDEKKIIRGKRMDHTNVLDVIEMVERKDKTTKH